MVEKECKASKAVLLCGGSYGGYLSGLLATRHAAPFAGAVLLNPVLSLPFMFYSTDIPEWVTA
jgi:acylaminoacyl-peptidase